MPDIKVTFIERCLKDYNESVIEGMRLAGQRNGLNLDGPGLQSLAYKAFQQGGGAYSSLSFKEYLRMVDMGVGRGHPLGGLKATTVSLAAARRSGKIFVKDNLRKPKKIYSKIAYGKLGYLQNKLMFGFTEETVTALKQELLSNTQ